MAEEPNEFTHVHVLKTTHRKIAILAQMASVQQGKKVNIYDLIASWVNIYWQQAKDAGMVTDAMLQVKPEAHYIGESPIKTITKKVKTPKKAVPS